MALQISDLKKTFGTIQPFISLVVSGQLVLISPVTIICFKCLLVKVAHSSLQKAGDYTVVTNRTGHEPQLHHALVCAAFYFLHGLVCLYLIIATVNIKNM